jgi:ATP/maltotriose-dependent transcriptional regulator MalT
MAGTAEVVIATKLFRPSLGPHTVERKRLHDMLRLGCTLPLTLIVAPAGWGKSTLVAEWLAHDGITAGWVSLDGGDSDPVRFWRYLLLAAGQAGSPAGTAALRRLDAAGSDVLRDVLPAFVNALVSAVLHRRAAQWYAEHNDATEAIGHAIASGDDALSSRLVAAHWLRAFNTGQLETVRMWLGALPAELVATDASLAAARVLLALDTGHLEEVSGTLDTAEASSPANTRLMFLRALHMYKTGDVGGAAALLRAISPDADDAFIATVHRLILGVTLMWLGDADRARELLVEAARRADEDDNRLAYRCAQGYQALLAVNRGDLALADSLAGDGESAVGQTLSESHFIAMFPALARARLELRRAD